MSTVKFNFYYSTTANGPWTLYNSTPLDREDSLQTYTISGLNSNTQYYVAVVGGVLDDSGDFLSLIHQPIGDSIQGASDINIRPNQIFTTITSAPRINNEGSLLHQFEVV